MLDRETKARIVDFWDAADLVDYLRLNTEDIVDNFEDEIEECLDDIEEYMGLDEENVDDEEE